MKWKSRETEYQTEYSREYRNNNPWITHHMLAKQRCTNPSLYNYSRYGGRGIKFSLTMEQIKKLWIRDQAHLMTSPSLDRKNRDSNYSSRNCRFIECSLNSSLGNRGENSHKAKLKEKDVILIRQLLKNNTAISIAKQFNVSESAIFHIKRGKSWRHI